PLPGHPQIPHRFVACFAACDRRPLALEVTSCQVLAMSEPAVRLLDDDEIVLRRTGVRFPVELRPTGFRADDPSTWPDAEGRLECVDGRLLYMPPCADVQQYVAVDVAYVLRAWSEVSPEFVVGGNEAGMKLGRDIRAADAGVWRRDAAGPPTGRLHRTPPVLAVEVAGEDEDEAVLRSKTQWYLRHGVSVVWIVLPEQRQVLVVGRAGETRCSRGERLPLSAELPGLAPTVEQFFAQLDGRG
ncbi:MAG TPA: Uma2 family endonuclease, partial [Gammaproteobacteria bacterium]|nr:Uma2 family endonuclease [Gammaproteobacteria bacterium]